MPGPKTVDPNLVTAATAIQRPGESADVQPDDSLHDVEPGTVLEAGGPPPAAAPTTKAEGMVKVRITKKGHDRVHTGNDVDGPKHYNWNDVVALPRTVALDLEDRGFAEIY